MNGNTEISRLIELIAEIRDDQKRLVEQQGRILELQQAYYDRSRRLQDRAESIQDKGVRIMTTARKTLFIVLPIIAVLLLYTGWLLLHYF